MVKRFIILFLISMSLIFNVQAIEHVNNDNVKGSKKSQYTHSIFSYNRVEIDNISGDDGKYIKGSKFQILDIAP